MKTNIRKIPAVLLLAVLCLTVFPCSAFAANAAEVRIPVTIETSGETPSPEESYTVKLKAMDDAPMPSENILKINGKGTHTFPVIHYTTPGTYCYRITQQEGSSARGHYDTTMYYVKVSVTNAENGNLETVIAVHTNAQMTDAKRDIIFINTYDPVKKTTESTTESMQKKKESRKITSKSKTKTGDKSDVVLFTTLLFASSVCLLLIAISRYREKYHKQQ